MMGDQEEEESQGDHGEGGRGEEEKEPKGLEESEETVMEHLGEEAEVEHMEVDHRWQNSQDYADLPPLEGSGRDRVEQEA